MELSKEATTWLAGMDASIAANKVIEAAADAVNTPSDSVWSDPELWNTHTLMFGTPDITLTDDYLIDYSNYRVAFAELDEAFPGDVEDASFGHWTYSRFVCVKVRVLDEAGDITGAFAMACDLAERIGEYPILDEQHYFDLEYEVQTESVRQWAEYMEVDVDATLNAWCDDVLYVDGVGSSFTILGANGETDNVAWDERDAVLVQLVRDHETKLLAEAAGAVVLEGM